MLNRIVKLFNLSKVVKSKKEIYGLDNLDDDVIGYPPNPQGIPVVQPQVLLDRMMVDVNAIKNEIGIEDEYFKKFILPVMVNFIEFVDLLPASEYKHHATGGGLVYHSFDVAKRAMRSAQHTQFPVKKTLLDTQQSKIQWKVGTILCALLHDSGKALTDMRVTNGESNKEKLIVWDAHNNESIYQWAKNNNIERYYVDWNRNRHNKHKKATVSVMKLLIPQETWSWLTSCNDGREIYSTMLESVSEQVDHPMSNIVIKADSASVKDDLLNRNSHITKEMKRIPLSILLADLIKHKMVSDSWAINSKGAKVWFVNNELYLLWETAALELVEDLKDGGYSIPELPITLARVLVEEGLAVANDEENVYFEFYPEILGSSKSPITLKGLKIHNPSRVVPNISKVYSIKEHEKTPTAKAKAETKAASNPTTAIPPQNPTQQIKKQRQFESSLDTLIRVLPFMKAHKAKAESEPLPQQAEQEEAEELEEAEPLQQTEYHNDTFQQQETTKSNDKEPVADKSTETSHNADGVECLTCTVAKTLLNSLKLEIQDEKVMLPESLLTQAIDIIHKTMPEIFTPATAIHESKEIELYE